MSSLGQRNKQWPHPPEALADGGVSYIVKFYGTHDVSEPKGMEAVKTATAKVKLEKQVRKAATGQRSSPKVEMVVGLAGIVIQDPRTKAVHYKFPLQRISYCADDKIEKKLLSFIAKDTERNTHVCYVLGNERCAEEIVLTIGQAFDLAYRRLLEKTDKENESQKQLLTLRQQVQSLQEENENLRARVRQLEESVAAVAAAEPPALGTRAGGREVQVESTKALSEFPSRPQAVVGRRLENLLYEFEDALYEAVDRKPVPTQALREDIYAVPVRPQSTAAWPQQAPTLSISGAQLTRPSIPAAILSGDLLDLGNAVGRRLNMDAQELSIDSFDPLRN